MRALAVGMEVTEADVERIPRTNLRVPVEDFVRVWVEAERRNAASSPAVGMDWYAGGVAMCCRWLAGVVVPPIPTRPAYRAYSPVTKRETRAYEELIQAELVEADKLDMEHPRPAWLLRRPGWSEGICAALHWAWMREGRPPLLDSLHSAV